jgi:hypothetical protein
LPARPLLGTGFAATTSTVEASSPSFRLTNFECQLGDALCGGADSQNAATQLMAPLVANATAVPTGAVDNIFSYFVGNGTQDHPNAGILIGDGYSFIENDVDVSPYCSKGQACNGGNGINDGNGGNGGDAGWGLGFGLATLGRVIGVDFGNSDGR